MTAAVTAESPLKLYVVLSELIAGTNEYGAETCLRHYDSVRERQNALDHCPELKGYSRGPAQKIPGGDDRGSDNELEDEWELSYRIYICHSVREAQLVRSAIEDTYSLHTSPTRCKERHTATYIYTFTKFGSDPPTSTSTAVPTAAAAASVTPKLIRRETDY